MVVVVVVLVLGVSGTGVRRDLALLHALVVLVLLLQRRRPIIPVQQVVGAAAVRREDPVLDEDSLRRLHLHHRV